MKHTFALILCIVCLQCFSQKGRGHNYVYEISMLSPVNGPELAYSDSAISIQFAFLEKVIQFKLKNKSSKAIKINWDEAAVVLFGMTDKIVHKGVKYIEKGAPMPMSVIPPEASLDDFALPVGNIYYESILSPIGWRQKPILPAFDWKNKEYRELAESLEGKEISLYLPIINGSDDMAYNFKFKVISVKCLNCK